MSELEQAAQWATIVGAPCAVMALVYAGLQIRQSVLIARGQFMLELERMIALHDPVHIRLRPRGDWPRTFANKVERGRNIRTGRISWMSFAGLPIRTGAGAHPKRRTRRTAVSNARTPT